MIRRFVAILFIMLVVAALWQCARRGSPTGGPKDITPPQLVKTEPDSMTVNFKAKRIRPLFRRVYQGTGHTEPAYRLAPIEIPTGNQAPGGRQ